MKRITAIFTSILASALLLGAFGASGTAVGAAPAPAHRPAVTLLAKSTPAQGAFYLKETNGSYYVGVTSTSAGSRVIEVGSGGKRLFTFPDTSGNYFNVVLSNGNLIASNASCGGVTVKSNPNADGTNWDWVQHNGSAYLDNAYCDRQFAETNDEVLTGHNRSGNQFNIDLIGGTGGDYQLISILN